MVLCVTIVRSLAAVWLAGLLSSAAEDIPHERKARSLTNFTCGISQRLYITEAYFLQQQSSDPPCKADCTPGNPQNPSSLSSKEDNNGLCRNHFSLHDLSTIYEMVDEGNPEALQSLNTSFSRRGNYVICYFCHRKRAEFSDLCKDPQREMENDGTRYTSVVVQRDGLEPECNVLCTLDSHQNHFRLSYIFLLNNLSAAGNNYLQLQYPHMSPVQKWTRVDSSYFFEDGDNFRLGKLSFKLHLADTSVISRFWLYFHGTEFTIKCTEEGEVQTTKSPEVTTISTGGGDTEFTINYTEEEKETTTLSADTTVSTGGGDARYTSYLLPVGVILAFIVICIVGIFIFRRFGPKSDAVSGSTTQTISVSMDSVPPTVPRSDNNTRQAQPPPCLGHQPSDSRRSGYEEVQPLLDTTAAQRGRDIGGIYNHLALDGMDRDELRTVRSSDYSHAAPHLGEDDYHVLQRQPGNPLVLDNDYDHTQSFNPSS